MEQVVFQHIQAGMYEVKDTHLRVTSHRQATWEIATYDRLTAAWLEENGLEGNAFRRLAEVRFALEGSTEPPFKANNMMHTNIKIDGISYRLSRYGGQQRYTARGGPATHDQLGSWPATKVYFQRNDGEYHCISMVTSGKKLITKAPTLRACVRKYHELLTAPKWSPKTANRRQNKQRKNRS